MDLRQNQALKLSSQLLMTPSLQQAIKLLQLSRHELNQHLTKELLENPLLEEVFESEEKEEGPATSEETVEDISFSCFEMDSLFERPSKKNLEESFDFEKTLTERPKLFDSLLAQLAYFELSSKQRQIALLILGNLDEKGFFSLSLESFFDKEGVSVAEVLPVLKILQQLEPHGVCARNLQECLLLQAKELKDPLIETMISKYFPDLLSRSEEKIARGMGLSLEEVKGLLVRVSKMEPVPARAFAQENTHFIVPDVFVSFEGGNFCISLNNHGVAQVKLSDQADTFSRCVQGSKDKVFLAEKLKSANWLLKTLEQRQKTLFQVSEALVKKQRAFFENGPLYLRPLILKDIADDLGLHESTVSRITSSKYIQSSWGIFKLKYFFTSCVSQGGEEALSSQAIKQMIKTLLNEEDSYAPLSDQKIVNILAKRSVSVARRTVTKYRQQMGFASASFRKKKY